MGAYSTINITRQKAKAVILSKMLGDLPDHELAELLFKVMGDRLYNYRIVDDSEENDDCLL